MPTQNRTSQLLDKHLLACAAVAAVGAGVTEQADASIMYSGLLDMQIDHTTVAGVYINFDALVAGTSGAATTGWDINLFNSNSTTTSRKAIRLYAPGADLATNQAVGANLPTYGYVSKLGAGVNVSAASTFATPVAGGYPYTVIAYRNSSGTYDQSQWNGGVTNGFMGFKFTGADAQTHYGWARLNIAAYTSATPYRMTVRDFGWESTPNAAIVTGAGIADVPEPAMATMLGALAMGASAFRPRKK